MMTIRSFLTFLILSPLAVNGQDPDFEVYKTLATVLTPQSLVADPHAVIEPNRKALLAECHQRLIDLKSIKTQDSALQHIRDKSKVALEQLTKLAEARPVLGENKNAELVYWFSVAIAVVTRNSKRLGGLIIDKANKWRADLDYFNALATCAENLNVMSQLLPKIAERFSAPLDPRGTEKFNVDLEEAWYGYGPHDHFAIRNKGKKLSDCTVVVELTGVDRKGEKEKNVNVHFVGEEWPGSPDPDAIGTRLGVLYRAPKAGFAAPEANAWNAATGKLVKTSVTSVQTIKVTILSPHVSTELNYQYAGAERDKDIKKVTSKLQLYWIAGGNGKFVRIGMQNYPELGPCEIEVTGKIASRKIKGKQDVKSWKPEQKNAVDVVIAPSPRGFRENDFLTVVLTFPGTGHKITRTLKRGEAPRNPRPVRGGDQDFAKMALPQLLIEREKVVRKIDAERKRWLAARATIKRLTKNGTMVIRPGHLFFDRCVKNDRIMTDVRRQAPELTSMKERIEEAIALKKKG